jgi:hypothetical protein
MFSIFIGRHFEYWKRYILLAYRRRNNLCSSLTLIYVTQWYSEGRQRKIRNLKYGWEIIKNKEGSETAEHVMGYWPMTMRISNFVIWPCSLTKNKNCRIWNISKLELICIVARQQWIFDSRETKTFANAGHKIQ